MIEQKVALGHRQAFGGFAGEQFAIGADLVGLWIHFDMRRGVVEFEVFLANVSGVFYREGLLGEAEGFADACGLGGFGNKADSRVLDRAAISAEHRA